MAMAAAVLTGLVAILHFYFLVLEMFLWNKPIGIKTFGHASQEFADASFRLAKNQGLYNGFLGAGLVWGLLAEPPFAFQLKVFFLACVLVAGLFGAVVSSKKILFAQALPALLALGLNFAAR